jgi:hypothetical protein
MSRSRKYHTCTFRPPLLSARTQTPSMKQAKSTDSGLHCTLNQSDVDLLNDSIRTVMEEEFNRIYELFSAACMTPCTEDEVRSSTLCNSSVSLLYYCNLLTMWFVFQCRKMCRSILNYTFQNHDLFQQPNQGVASSHDIAPNKDRASYRWTPEGTGLLLLIDMVIDMEFSEGHQHDK